MELLERQNFLDELRELASDVSAGSGRTVLVSGEAGVGKTSLIKWFTGSLDPGCEILWGGCDDLFTPRPLGPVYDIACQINSDLMKKLENEDNRAAIFTTFLNYLRSGSNLKIVVFEDIHWADEATLDIIKFLVRRISLTKAILVLSYRDEEIAGDNRLRAVFGDMPQSEIKRIRLYPLSENAVASLMKKAGIQNVNLYERTGGNPFYVTELLAHRNDDLPLSIKDAVTARILNLDKDTKDLLEIISVIPTKAEIGLLRKLSGDPEERLDHCINKKILITNKNLVSFRHELARQAILDSIPEMKRTLIHQKVLTCLLENENKQDLLARISHHALQAGNKNIILEYAPLAAKQASYLGAHSLAADHYKNALNYADSLDTQTRLDLYEGKMYECYLTGQIEEAIEAAEKLIALFKEHPDPLREGENYRRMSRIFWYNCQDEKGEECLDKAVEILENYPLSKSLAMAYSNRSQTYMTREELEKGIEWGKIAVELARKLDDPEIEAHALNSIGTARLYMGLDEGEDDLKKSLEISLKHNSFENGMRAYLNLGGAFLYRHDLAKADRYYSAGAEYCSDRDLYVFGLCLAGHHSKVHLYSGDWDKAADRANHVISIDNVPSGNRLMPLAVIGTIRARRNDPGAEALLDGLIERALNMGEIEKIVSVESARAEFFWLQNRMKSVTDELNSVYDRVQKTKNPWAIGEIAYWVWKAGQLKEIPGCIAEPYLKHIKGEWKTAAHLWEKLHCPYEQALALSEGDSSAMKKAVEIFDKLGALATSRLLKQKMRESGIKKIPKGPRQSTRENPAGLTRRQTDVLKLLTRGLSNSEIATDLFISPKTVDHHISAILAKLNLHSRTEAAAFVQVKGILLEHQEAGRQ
jgi:DNA-binding CsgD family transcriptional regulator/tetratricopeptide (TPR) repeat protein